jgi:hypothetical protein
MVIAPIIHRRQPCESKQVLAIGERKLSEPASIIRGVSYPGISYVGVRKTNSNTRTKTKAASAMASSVERQFKLKELGRMIRGI